LKRRSGFLPLLEHVRKNQRPGFYDGDGGNWPSELSKELQRWEVKTEFAKH